MLRTVRVLTSSKACDVRAEKGLNGGLPASSSDEASSMPKSSSSSEPTSDRGALQKGRKPRQLDVS